MNVTLIISLFAMVVFLIGAFCFSKITNWLLVLAFISVLVFGFEFTNSMFGTKGLAFQLMWLIASIGSVAIICFCMSKAYDKFYKKNIN